jgi:hypothetical protein
MRKLDGEHGFEVGKQEHWKAKPTYRVQLPHSCDEWVVADADTKGEAVAELETFIAEAQAALEALHNLD